MGSEQSANAVACYIGVREVLSGDGAVRRRLTVHCDVRSGAVDVAICAGCERCVQVRAPALGRPGAVLCRRLDGDAAHPADPDPRTPVGAVMERDIVCVTADVSVACVTALLRAWDASGVPVVDDDGRPIGMISSTDLLRVHRDVAGLSAGDVMTPRVFSVVETADLSSAIALMSTEGFHQLTVVLGDGSVGGLLSTRHVARWVAQPQPGAAAVRSGAPRGWRECGIIQGAR